MMGGILDVARLGDSQKLNAFVKKWIAEQLQLAEVELVLDGEQADNIAERGGDNLFRFSSLEKRQDIFSESLWGDAFRVKPGRRWNI